MRAATLLLCMALVVGSSMAAINSPNDVITANPDTFNILKAIVAKADAQFADALGKGDLANTYFLPTDAAFLFDLAYCLSNTGNASDTTTPTSAEILSLVNAMSSQAATDFIKGHVIAQSLPTLKSLNDTGVAATALAGSNLTFSVVSDPTAVTIITVPTGGTDFTFESAISGSSIVGPVAIPAGTESTVYVVDHVLADPKLITGTDCQSSASAADASGFDDLGGFGGADNSTDTAPAAPAPTAAPSASGRKLFNLFW